MLLQFLLEPFSNHNHHRHQPLVVLFFPSAGSTLTPLLVRSDESIVLFTLGQNYHYYLILTWSDIILRFPRTICTKSRKKEKYWNFSGGSHFPIQVQYLHSHKLAPAAHCEAAAYLTGSQFPVFLLGEEICFCC